MSNETVAFLARTVAMAGHHGCTPRRLIITIDLPDPPEGSNDRLVDVTHHIDIDTLRDDPGVLGAMIQCLLRKPDA